MVSVSEPTPTTLQILLLAVPCLDIGLSNHLHHGTRQEVALPELLPNGSSAVSACKPGASAVSACQPGPSAVSTCQPGTSGVSAHKRRFSAERLPSSNQAKRSSLPTPGFRDYLSDEE